MVCVWVAGGRFDRAMVVDGSLVWAVSFVGVSLLRIAVLSVYSSAN